MKTAFTFNGQHYLSPTKAEARAFLRNWNSELSGSPVLLYRFVTNWKFRTVEKAPSYCQVMKISSGKVQFEMI